ncbi:MAG: acetyltransferase [Dehalococcoidia bacterium]
MGTADVAEIALLGRRSVIIWGAAGHAKVVAECLSPQNFVIVAIFDSDPALSSPLAGVTLYSGMPGFLKWYEASSPRDVSFILAIGGDKGRDRHRLHGFLLDNGLKPLSIVHRTAFVAASASIGEGCQILAQASVCVDARLGTQTIVNTAASVDHESVLGVGVHVAPGAVLCGCLEVGDFTMIGAGAVVLPRIRIGRNVTVGAGSVVTKPIPDNAIVWGCPARIQRYKDAS